jgi:LysR family glycine cleavage system transcriptional activator
MPSAKVLQTFEVTARLGSFTLAARELFLTQSAISRQIKSLEETLEFQLFIRDNNRLLLTERGRVFYETVSRFLRDLFSTVDGLRRQAGVRRLLFVTPPTFTSRWLAPRLEDFRRICPAPLTLNNHQNLSYSPLGDYDCQVAFGREDMSSLGGRLLFPEAIAPACSPDKKAEILARKSLETIPLLHTLDQGTRLPYWEIWLEANPESEIRLNSVDLASGIEFSTQNQTMIAAQAGLGLAMIDVNIASHILRKRHLTLLGEPVQTVYGYWIFPSTTKYPPDDPANLLYKWVVEQSRQCLL